MHPASRKSAPGLEQIRPLGYKVIIRVSDPGKDGIEILQRGGHEGETLLLGVEYGEKMFPKFENSMHEQLFRGEKKQSSSG